MADRRRRRRQNSNDSVVESEDEGVGDEDADGRPIPRTAGRDYYQASARENCGGDLWSTQIWANKWRLRFTASDKTWKISDKTVVKLMKNSD